MIENREEIFGKLGSKSKELLLGVEEETELEIRFKELSADSYVIATYRFIPQDKAIISLRNDWEDCDVAHELMHMKIELIERFCVLAWRRTAEREKRIERAFGRIRSYVDDEVVHARLVQEGYKLDGEVFRPQLFDDIYTRTVSKLKKMRPRSDDNMGHLDDIGFGELCRSSFFVQAQLILESYDEDLIWDRRKRIERFVSEFRAQRGPEAERADKVLVFFQEHDVQSVDGHSGILAKWAALEDLDKFVGVSSYQKDTSGFLLPFP